MNDERRAKIEAARAKLRVAHEQRALVAEEVLIRTARVHDAKSNLIINEVELARLQRRHEAEDQAYQAVAREVHDLECPFCSAAIAENKPKPHAFIIN